MSYHTRSRASSALYSPLIENAYEITNDGQYTLILLFTSLKFCICYVTHLKFTNQYMVYQFHQSKSYIVDRLYYLSVVTDLGSIDTM
jgi:hypothetical protein